MKKLINKLNDRSLNYGEIILKDWSSKISPKNILDIGAGKGRDLNFFSGKNIKRNAIESYPPFIEILKKNNINVANLDLEKDTFPFENESLNLIIANQILEHCKEIFWIHHEIFRTLKVGGHMIVGFPNLATYYNRISLLFGNQPYCISLDSAHVRGFTKNGYISFLNVCIPDTYELKYFRGANFVPFPKKLSIILSRAFPSHSTCIFFMIKKVKKYNTQFLDKTKNLETPFWIGK